MKFGSRFIALVALSTGLFSGSALAGAAPLATPPSAPTNVAAYQSTLTPSLLVSWTAPANAGSGSISSYAVTATVGGVNFACAPKPATTTTCIIKGLAASTTYAVTVTAKNSAKATSPASGSVNGITKDHVLYNAKTLNLNDPDGLAYDGSNVWSVNYLSHALSEMSTSGAPMWSSASGATTLATTAASKVATWSSGATPIIGAAVSGSGVAVGSYVKSVFASASVTLHTTAGSAAATYTGGGTPFAGLAVTGAAVASKTTLSSVNSGSSSVVLSKAATQTSNSGTTVAIPASIRLSANATGSSKKGGSAAALGLNAPFSIISVGDSLFISNSAGGSDGNGSITEVTKTGSFVRSVSNGDAAYGFYTPAFMAYDNGHLFVTNSGPELYGVYDGAAVTVINTDDGSLNTVLRASDGYGFSGPTGISLIGDNLWVANYTGGLDGNGSVTIFAKSDFSLVGVKTNNGTAYGFGQPYAFTTDGSGKVWVANGSGFSTSCGQAEGCGSLTVMSSSGGLVTNYHGTSYQFNDPAGIINDGNGHIWVSNYGPVTASSAGGGNSITEINASDGSVVKVLSDKSFAICTPNVAYFFASAIWLPNGCKTNSDLSGTGSITKIIP